jgi:D-xylose transport system permease protein
MSNETQDSPQPSTLLDRSDVRVKHATGIGGAVAAFVERVRSGDLGSLPVIAGLIIIWTVFTCLNPVFLSANNLVNLLFDCSTVGVIALGIVCVLMVGQIDLSVGSMSGFASALVGTLWVNHGWPVLLAIVTAVAVGALVGVLYGLLLNLFGMPSFVATLAGLLAILGSYVLGTTDQSTCHTAPMVNFGQLMIIPAAVSHFLRRAPWSC